MGGGWENMKQDVGGGECWAKDDVTFLNIKGFRGKIINNLI